MSDGTIVGVDVGICVQVDQGDRGVQIGGLIQGPVRGDVVHLHIQHPWRGGV